MQYTLDRWREIARAMFKSSQRRSLRRQRGMSLIEVMVVIAIILTLTSVLAIGIFNVFGQAQADATKLTMTKIDAQVTVYKMRHKQKLPSSLKEAFGDDDVPTDAWGNEFQYSVSGRDYELVSLGSDGAPGGSGEASDLKWSELK